MRYPSIAFRESGTHTHDVGLRTLPFDADGRNHSLNPKLTALGVQVIVSNSKYGYGPGDGRTMENVVPCGSLVRERTQMEPSCFSMICLQTQRPRPFPVDPLVVKNGSNILGNTAALIPWPLSAIVIRMRELPSR